MRPWYNSGGWSLASHRGGPGSNPGQDICDLWWTKWNWGRFSKSTSVSPVKNSTDCFTFITIKGVCFV
jgi:hypothetical protein